MGDSDTNKETEEQFILWQLILVQKGSLFNTKVGESGRVSKHQNLFTAFPVHVLLSFCVMFIFFSVLNVH
jgi:hypothetical protein